MRERLSSIYPHFSIFSCAGSLLPLYNIYMRDADSLCVKMLCTM